VTTIEPSEVAFGTDGLVPAIVQDAATGRVLMLAWMDAEALAATLSSGDVHFHSRSRDRLWRKGETSGNVLHVVDVAVDCDGDALLVTAEPAGPTCHRGTTSCFDKVHPGQSGPIGPGPTIEAAPLQGFAFLEDLWSTIRARVEDPPPGSYTAKLVAGGVDAVGRKVTEEATEVLLAARDDAEAEAYEGDRVATRDALRGEAADLLYHALVLLAERGLAPAAVIATLRERHRP